MQATGVLYRPVVKVDFSIFKLKESERHFVCRNGKLIKCFTSFYIRLLKVTSRKVERQNIFPEVTEEVTVELRSPKLRIFKGFLC